LHFERYDGALFDGVADNAQRVDLAQLLVRIPDQNPLVRADPPLAHRIDVVDGGAKTDRLYDCRRARLEFVRRLAVRNPILEDLVDHFTAAVEWRHPHQVLMFAIERPDPRRPVNLVSRKDVEVAADVLHVDVHMHRGLRAIDQYRDAARVRNADDILHRNDGA